MERCGAACPSETKRGKQPKSAGFISQMVTKKRLSNRRHLDCARITGNSEVIPGDLTAITSCLPTIRPEGFSPCVLFQESRFARCPCTLMSTGILSPKRGVGWGCFGRDAPSRITANGALGYPGARPSAPVTIKKDIQGSAVASFRKWATIAGTKLRRPRR